MQPKSYMRARACSPSRLRKPVDEGGASGMRWGKLAYLPTAARR